MTPTDIPPGFEPHYRKSPLTDPWEPLYSKRTDKAVIIVLRLAKPHTNGRGLIHGGLIGALADNAMGHSCAHQMGGVSSLVTISLAVDFIGKCSRWRARALANVVASFLLATAAPLANVAASFSASMRASVVLSAGQCPMVFSRDFSLPLTRAHFL